MQKAPTSPDSLLKYRVEVDEADRATKLPGKVRFRKVPRRGYEETRHRVGVYHAGDLDELVQRLPFISFKAGQIGIVLRRLRLENGLTQVQLAVASGISNIHVSQLEMGRFGNRVRLGTIARLANAFGLSAEEFIARAHAERAVKAKDLRRRGARPVVERPCLAPDCKGLSFGRGLCFPHYQRCYRMVRRGEATWAELERAGAAAKVKRGQA
jgi:transcriptional regulator with XRE-family HTH domain